MDTEEKQRYQTYNQEKKKVLTLMLASLLGIKKVESAEASSYLHRIQK